MPFDRPISPRATYILSVTLWTKHGRPPMYLQMPWYVIVPDYQQEKLWPPNSWWRHQMETVSALLAICAGNSPVPVNSPHKGQWRGALMFSLICVWINGWVNNGEAGDMRRYLVYCDVIVMTHVLSEPCWSSNNLRKSGASFQNDCCDPRSRGTSTIKVATCFNGQFVLSLAFLTFLTCFNGIYEYSVASTQLPDLL